MTAVAAIERICTRNVMQYTSFFIRFVYDTLEIDVCLIQSTITVRNVKECIEVSAVWSHFLEHRLKDGRLETGQTVGGQTDPGAVAVTVSFM